MAVVTGLRPRRAGAVGREELGCQDAHPDDVLAGRIQLAPLRPAAAGLPVRVAHLCVGEVAVRLGVETTQGSSAGAVGFGGAATSESLGSPLVI